MRAMTNLLQPDSKTCTAEQVLDYAEARQRENTADRGLATFAGVLTAYVKFLVMERDQMRRERDEVLQELDTAVQECCNQYELDGHLARVSAKYGIEWRKPEVAE